MRLTGLAQRTYPVLFKVCPLTMRTQTILLVRDATLFLDIVSDGGERVAIGIWRLTSRTSPPISVHRSTQWRQSCDQLITLLDGYSETLLCNLRTFIEIGDNSGAEMIWSSCITCLACLTALCELVGRTEPTASLAMNALCDRNLERLGHLTEDIRSEEYTYLDLLLGVRTLRRLLGGDID